MLCALISRPLEFIQDFSVFLSGILAKFDSVLVLGDFNIHVCCHQKPLVKDVLDLIDSFNITQSVKSPTHERGHTLDLVLSCGLQLQDIQICNLNFLDHMPVLLKISIPWSLVKPPLPACQHCITGYCGAVLCCLPELRSPCHGQLLP